MVGVAWVLDKFRALPDHFAPRKAAAPESA
jgi:hypothetical protein